MSRSANSILRGQNTWAVLLALGLLVLSLALDAMAHRSSKALGTSVGWRHSWSLFVLRRESGELVVSDRSELDGAFARPIARGSVDTVYRRKRPDSPLSGALFPWPTVEEASATVRWHDVPGTAPAIAGTTVVISDPARAREIALATRVGVGGPSTQLMNAGVMANVMIQSSRLLLVGALVSGAVALRRMMREKRVGGCPDCGYSLHALSAARCPECECLLAGEELLVEGKAGVLPIPAASRSGSNGTP